jgi:hypothetical protein
VLSSFAYSEFHPRPRALPLPPCLLRELCIRHALLSSLSADDKLVSRIPFGIASFADPHPLTPVESCRFKKHPGEGCPSFYPNTSNNSLTPVFATHPKNTLITPLLATHPKSLDLKSFVYHTSAKVGGGVQKRLTRLQIKKPVLSDLWEIARSLRSKRSDVQRGNGPAPPPIPAVLPPCYPCGEYNEQFLSKSFTVRGSPGMGR